MRLHIRIDVLHRSDRLIGELLEQGEHALCGLAGRGKEPQCRLIGGRLHRPRIIQDQPSREILAAEHDALPGARHLAVSADGAPGHRRRAKQHADDRRRADPVHLHAHARQMTPGDMSGLVGENSDHFIGKSWPAGAILYL